MLFHHFERFLAEYETRFEREYGYFRPIVKDVGEKYLDCGNPKCGFARIRCPEAVRNTFFAAISYFLVVDIDQRSDLSYDSYDETPERAEFLHCPP